MSKPISKDSKHPFGVTGILVTLAVLHDGTIINDLHIYKQRSHNIFDLIDKNLNIYQFMEIKVTDKNNKLIPANASNSDLIGMLSPGTFCIKAYDNNCNSIGYVLKILLNKTVLGDRTIYNNSIYGDCTPNIVDLDSIKFDRPEFFLIPDVPYEIPYTITPYNATDKTITMTSSDSDIVTVNGGSIVEAKTYGGSELKIESLGDDTKSDICQVYVIDPTVEFESQIILIGLNKPQKIEYYTPDNYRPGFKFAIEDKTIVNIDSNEMITGIKEGETGVKIYDPNNEDVNDICTYIVIIPSEEIRVPNKNIKLAKNETLNLNATVIPENATYKDELVYSSSNYKKVNVNENGDITGKDYTNGDDVEVIISCGDGFSEDVTCFVDVYKIEVPIKRIKYSKDVFTYIINDSISLEPLLLPLTTTQTSYTVESSDENICKIEFKYGSYYINCIGIGDATITTTSLIDKDVNVSFTVSVVDVVGITAHIPLNNTMISNTISHAVIETIPKTDSYIETNTTLKNISGSPDTIKIFGNRITSNGIPGTVTLEAEYKGFTSQFDITIVDVPKLETELPIYYVQKGSYYTLSVKNISQENIAFLKYEILEGSSLIEFENSPYFIALDVGDVKIRLFTRKNNDVIAEVVVNIKIVDEVDFKSPIEYVIFGDKKTINLTNNVEPSELLWESSDPSTISVTPDGVLHSHQYGFITLTGKTKSGIVIKCIVHTVESYVKPRQLVIKTNPFIYLNGGVMSSAGTFSYAFVDENTTNQCLEYIIPEHLKNNFYVHWDIVKYPTAEFPVVHVYLKNPETLPDETEFEIIARTVDGSNLEAPIKITIRE